MVESEGILRVRIPWTIHSLNFGCCRQHDSRMTFQTDLVWQCDDWIRKGSDHSPNLVPSIRSNADNNSILLLLSGNCSGQTYTQHQFSDKRQFDITSFAYLPVPLANWRWACSNARASLAALLNCVSNAWQCAVIAAESPFGRLP